MLTRIGERILKIRVELSTIELMALGEAIKIAQRSSEGDDMPATLGAASRAYSKLTEDSIARGDAELFSATQADTDSKGNMEW